MGKGLLSTSPVHHRHVVTCCLNCVFTCMQAEESWALPALQASGDDHLVAEDQQREEQAPQEEEEEDKEASLKVDPSYITNSCLVIVPVIY